MISGLPFTDNFLIYIFLVSLLSGIIALLFLVLKVLARTVQSIRGRKAKRVSLSQNAFTFIFILFWISFSAAGLFFTAFIRSHQSFTNKELVAVVRCIPSDKKLGEMSMELKFVEDGQMGNGQAFLIKGDQWSIEGDILKWEDWLNFFGFHTMYKLTRVRGRYVDTRQEIHNPPTVYGLVENQEDPEWPWLHKYGHRLPFVTAVYGNTVFTYPSRKETFQIYVTTSGFMLQVVGK